MCSLRFVCFPWLRQVCLWVRSGSSSSSGCALGVIGYVRVDLVRPGVLWGFLGSLGFVRLRSGGRWVGIWYVRVYSGGRWIRLGSSVSS